MGILFGLHFRAIFWFFFPKSLKCGNHAPVRTGTRKPRFPQPKIHQKSIIFPIEFSCFFRTPPGEHFWPPKWRSKRQKVAIVTPNGDFGTPLGPSWVQNGTRNLLKGADLLQKQVTALYFSAFLLRRSPPSAPRHHFGWILNDFGIIFRFSPRFSTKFADANCKATQEPNKIVDAERPPTPLDTGV